jgi:hypothetical protein
MRAFTGTRHHLEHLAVADQVAREWPMCAGPKINPAPAPVTTPGPWSLVSVRDVEAGRSRAWRNLRASPKRCRPPRPIAGRHVCHGTGGQPSRASRRHVPARARPGSPVRTGRPPAASGTGRIRAGTQNADGACRTARRRQRSGQSRRPPRPRWNGGRPGRPRHDIDGRLIRLALNRRQRQPISDGGREFRACSRWQRVRGLLPAALDRRHQLEDTNG